MNADALVAIGVAVSSAQFLALLVIGKVLYANGRELGEIKARLQVLEERSRPHAQR